MRHGRDRPRFFPLSVIPLLLGILLLTSCGTSSQSGRAHPSMSPFGVGAPRQGYIIYHDPKPKAGSYRQGGRRPRPITITITTFYQQGKRRDDSITVQSGRLEGRPASRMRTEKSTILDLFKQASPSYTTSPQKFQQLWSGLEALGIFRLPQGSIPADKPSIRLMAGGKTRVYLRPTDVPFSRLPSNPRERDKVVKAWMPVKMLIVNFVP